jgi:hypothetical protein
MIDPRAGLHILSREPVASHAVDDSCNAAAERLRKHDGPTSPVHPELEYEVLSQGSKDPLHEQNFRESSIEHDPRRDLKLLLSFIFLVIAGSGNVVAAKLQAIPM